MSYGLICLSEREIESGHQKSYGANVMINTVQIEKMSREEKLQTMEALWADLSKVDTEVESPAWHEAVLKKTEARVAEGQERIADWEMAKRELRARFG